MKIVVDASVALKWMFRTRDDEADVAQALELLRGVLEDRITLVQPPHFVAEVSAVLARESPERAQSSLRDLLDIEMQIVETENIYARAVSLAVRHGHHLFDTLYHAVALEMDDAMLVTADDHYIRKAKADGRIIRLSAFALASSGTGW